MKVRVQFVADCVMHGGKISKDDLVLAWVDWLYEQDEQFAETIVDYISEECEFDHFEISIDQVRVT